MVQSRLGFLCSFLFFLFFFPIKQFYSFCPILTERRLLEAAFRGFQHYTSPDAELPQKRWEYCWQYLDLSYEEETIHTHGCMDARMQAGNSSSQSMW